MDTMERPKLKMAEILKDAWKLYKENAGLFIKIGLLVFLLQFAYSTFGILSFLIKEETIQKLHSFLNILFLFPYLIFYIKLTIAQYSVITGRLNGYDVGVKYGMEVSSDRFWAFVFAGVKFFLILLIPVVGVYAIIGSPGSALARILISLIFFLPGVYLYTVYQFGPLISVLDEDFKPYFKKAKNWSKETKGKCCC